MASDPTDLIRDVDLVHASGMMSKLDGPGLEECCAQCGTRWPCEVRRLRDALEAAAGDACGTCLAIARDAREERDAALALLDRERAALAEANATIEHVRALHVQVRICTDVRTGAWRWECAECGEAGDDGEWPCDTAKAIEGEQA